MSLDFQPTGWEPDGLFNNPLFEPLSPLFDLLRVQGPQWPGLEDYQQWLNEHVGRAQSKGGGAIRFVAQGGRPACWEEGYEPRIYLKGEVQTRIENWHDLFQVLVWSTFPRTKVELNARHYESIAGRVAADPSNKRRTPAENALTQFDECGGVVLASDPRLLELVESFRWKELFWRQRAAVKLAMRHLIFGHATYEKALRPYTGMTTHCLLLSVDQALFSSPQREQLAWIDQELAKRIGDAGGIRCPRDLSPFPLLGYPGFSERNRNEAYYDNTGYFRPGRSHFARSS